MIAPADTVRTPDDVLSPIFSLGDLPRCIRLRQPWKRFPAGTRFEWSDHGRGFFTQDGQWVVLASTVRGLGPGFFAEDTIPVSVDSTQLTFSLGLGV